MNDDEYVREVCSFLGAAGHLSLAASRASSASAGLMTIEKDKIKPQAQAAAAALTVV